MNQILSIGYREKISIRNLKQKSLRKYTSKNHGLFKPATACMHACRHY